MVQMLLVVCVDLDDDVGRKVGVETPVMGRDAVERTAVELATVDPEDSDANVLFQGLHLYDSISDEAVEIAVVTGNPAADVSANRELGEELDTVLARLTTDESVRAIVVTDGAQDESVIPVIRSRVAIDGVRRVVVRQAQDLESMYYTIKQVIDDPETRGTILIPLGILLLIYPIAVIADSLGFPGAVFGVVSALLGLYFLFRGVGLEEAVDSSVARARHVFFAGRVTLVTYLVAVTLLVIGGVSGMDMLESLSAATPGALSVIEIGAALIYGAIVWFGAAGLVSSMGKITDEYLNGTLRWRHLNAPVYVLAIAVILHAVSSYLLGFQDVPYVAFILTMGTLVGVLSTLGFAIAETRFPRSREQPS